MPKKDQHAHALPELPEAIAALAENPSFSGSDRLAIAGRTIMAQHVRKLYAHLPGVLGGDDPHDVHQMRVATRRLRASLQATEEAYRGRRVDALTRELRKLARSLGAVRDRDVLLMRLQEDADKMRAATAMGTAESQSDTLDDQSDTAEQTGPLQRAIDRLTKERAKAHATLVSDLGRKRTRRLLDDLNDFLTCPLEEVEATRDARMPVLVRHHAGSALWREYEAVRRFETRMPTDSSEELHRLRIAAKHLRYTMELFQPALGVSAKDLIKQAETLQEHLGKLHDTDVALEYLQQAASNQAKSAKQNGAGASDDAAADGGILDEYIAVRQRERQELIDGAEPVWQQLVSDETRHRVATMIAEL